MHYSPITQKENKILNFDTLMPLLGPLSLLFMQAENIFCKMSLKRKTARVQVTDSKCGVLFSNLFSSKLNLPYAHVALLFYGQTAPLILALH